VGETLSGRHLHARASISAARVPPVVPNVRLDSGSVSLAKDARHSVAFQDELTIENGKAFDELRVTVFTDDPASD
jgi:hypothetical protein